MHISWGRVLVNPVALIFLSSLGDQAGVPKDDHLLFQGPVLPRGGSSRFHQRQQGTACQTKHAMKDFQGCTCKQGDKMVLKVMLQKLWLLSKIHDLCESPMCLHRNTKIYFRRSSHKVSALCFVQIVSTTASLVRQHVLSV